MKPNTRVSFGSDFSGYIVKKMEHSSLVEISKKHLKIVNFARREPDVPVGWTSKGTDRYCYVNNKILKEIPSKYPNEFYMDFTCLSTEMKRRQLEVLDNLGFHNPASQSPLHKIYSDFTLGREAGILVLGLNVRLIDRHQVLALAKAGALPNHLMSEFAEQIDIHTGLVVDGRVKPKSKNAIPTPDDVFTDVDFGDVDTEFTPLMLGYDPEENEDEPRMWFTTNDSE